jgi:prepilin peptidase CpaA
MIVVQPVVLGALTFSLVLAFITDIRLHKIPNWLTYPVIFLAILSYSVVNGWHGLLFSIEGLALGLVMLMPFYMIGGMGAGDVKLMGAVGAALGPGHLFYAFFCTAIAGGVYAAIVLLLQAGRLRELASGLYSALRTFVLVEELSLPRLEAEARGMKLYYGVAISIGTLVYIFFEVYLGNLGTGFQVFM